MAFIDIKDPKKREEIVQDYIKNLKEIHERVENEKVKGLTQRREIAKVFQPIVQATEKSSEKISSEIKNLQNPPTENSPNRPPNLDYFLTQFSKSKLDDYFGIQERPNGVYVMGEKEIMIDNNNNIILDDGRTVFKGTKGLYRLIMENKPESYHPEYLENHKELLEKTNAINSPLTNSSANRPTTTSKWTFFKEQGLIKSGTGATIILPGDINGLLQQFRLLIAEHRAGNKSATQNTIVAILDQLLQRGVLTQNEYNAVCKTLSC